MRMTGRICAVFGVVLGVGCAGAGGAPDFTVDVLEGGPALVRVEQTIGGAPPRECTTPCVLETSGLINYRLKFEADGYYPAIIEVIGAQVAALTAGGQAAENLLKIPLVPLPPAEAEAIPQ